MPLASLEAIRDGLAAALEPVAADMRAAGLHCQVSAKALANPTPPTIQVMGPEKVDYLMVMQRGGVGWELVVQAFTPFEVFAPEAQEMVDAWLNPTGDRSVWVALEADETLGGIVDDVTVRSSEGYQMYVLPGIGAVLGCDWLVEVIG